MRWISCVVLLLIGAAEARGQDHRVLVRGMARTSSGEALPGVNVFITGTLDGAVSDSSGRFAFRTAPRDPFVISGRRIGFRDTQVTAAGSNLEQLVLVLTRETVSIAPIVVEAGRYAA